MLGVGATHSRLGRIGGKSRSASLPLALRARNRTEAAVRAMAMGLLSGEEVSLADGADSSR